MLFGTNLTADSVEMNKIAEGICAFFEKKYNFLAYVKKKQYLCTRFRISLGSVVVLISLRTNDLLPALRNRAGSSSARLECLLWEQEVVSSNLAYPTKRVIAWLSFN